MLSPLLACTGLVVQQDPLISINEIVFRSIPVMSSMISAELWLETKPDGQMIVDILGLTLHVLVFFSSVIHYTILCTLQFFPLKSYM